MAPAPIRKLRIQLMAGVAVVVALVWAAVAYQLDRERAAALKLATQQGRNLSSVVADHFANYAESVDVFVRRLRLQWQGNPERFAESVALAEGLRKDISPARVVVLDARGRAAYVKPAQQGPLPLDSEVFAAHRDRPDDELRIGNPVKDETGTQLVYFSRPILDAKGGFSGVIALAVSPEPLTQLYRGLDLGAKGFVGVRRLDDTLFLRWPDIMVTGSKVPALPKGVAASGSDVRQGSLDGVQRIFSFQRVSGLPFYAVVGQAVDAVLGEYREERGLYLAAGAFLTLVVLWFGAVLLAKVRREESVETALSDSEARFRSLTELASDMYWEQDSEYRFVSVAGGGTRWTRQRRSEAIGKRPWDFNYVNMTEADWAAHREVLAARKPFQDVELCRIDAKGRRIWVSVSGEPVFDASGAFTGYRGIGKDITARKRDEALLKLEHAVARQLAEADSASDGLKAVMREICETEDWDSGRYFVWDEAAGVLRFHEHWNVPGERMDDFIERSRGLTYEPGAGLVGWTFKTQEPLWSPDTSTDPR